MVNQFSSCVEVLISADPEDMLTAEQVLTQPLLRTDLVMTLKFLEEITLKTKPEKDEFFQ